MILYIHDAKSNNMNIILINKTAFRDKSFIKEPTIYEL
jgi:hypothetical protein